ncbi:hypothetical protein [Streptomyces sp. SID13031]|uniref:hypothetical protein n=1 Tax=Streptomyces sp. SID13031 TaxID=2706046 RepID=UPI0013C6DE97|nr:hypothetical protein [Streptomyces sp. SID13031]NEA34207.1 hypothetical protein [Streptomyces sp. SID13031]
MKSLVSLRLVAVLHAVAVCLQPVLAGVYLNGSGSAMRLHEPLGLGLAFVCLGLVLVATIYWRAGGRARAVLVALLLLAAESFQIAMGYNRQLALHIPLGITIVAIACALAVWTFRPAARVRRTRKRAAEVLA